MSAEGSATTSAHTTSGERLPGRYDTNYPRTCTGRSPQPEQFALSGLRWLPQPLEQNAVRAKPTKKRAQLVMNDISGPLLRAHRLRCHDEARLNIGACPSPLQLATQGCLHVAPAPPNLRAPCLLARNPRPQVCCGAPRHRASADALREERGVIAAPPRQCAEPPWARRRQHRIEPAANLHVGAWVAPCVGGLGAARDIPELPVRSRCACNPRLPARSPCPSCT